MKGQRAGTPALPGMPNGARPLRHSRFRGNDGVGEAGMTGLGSGNDKADTARASVGSDTARTNDGTNTARANDKATIGIARMARQERPRPPEKRRPIRYNLPQSPTRQPPTTNH